MGESTFNLSEELEQVRRLCHDKVADSKLVTCTNQLVRVEISKSKEKSLVVVLQFPEDYPASHELLVELRSKTLDDKLLDRLTKICEEEARKYLGEPQILMILKFITKFLDENPLCSCAIEISEIKRALLKDSDTIKLKQKISSIALKIREKSFYFNCILVIPHNYPESAVKVENIDSNFPGTLCRVFLGHTKEISRQCVEPPLNKSRTSRSGQPFKPRPSLLPVVNFFISHIHRYPTENCPCCRCPCFPENIENIVTDENNDRHIERLYCGHLYHLKCLLDYLKTPPFAGGKKCVVCKQEVYHDKYKVSPRLAEARWAHQQARQREIDEVAEFFT